MVIHNLSENNCWYDFNDSRVSKTLMEQMVHECTLAEKVFLTE